MSPALDFSQHKLLLEHLPAIVWATDVADRLIYANRAAEIFFGRDQIDGISWLDLVHPQDRDRVRRAIDPHRTAGAPFSIDLRMRHRRSWRQIETAIQPMINAGEFSGFLAVVHDHAAADAPAKTPSRKFEDELRGALDGGAMTLYFQPKFDVQSARLIGFEALLRWRHPVRGLLKPKDFMTLAEQHNLIGALTQWVFDATARHTAACIDARLEPKPIAVNVPPTEFAHALVDRHLPAYRRYRLPPGLLELEITEHPLLDDLDDTSAIVEALERDGIRVAMDDFGTGYSSLARLSRLPVSILKIDQALTADLERNAGSRAIASGIIGIARSLGLDVVAEGVESNAQLQALRGLDCNIVQGYLTGRPMPADAAMALLEPAKSLSVTAAL